MVVSTNTNLTKTDEDVTFQPNHGQRLDAVPCIRIRSEKIQPGGQVELWDDDDVVGAGSSGVKV